MLDHKAIEQTLISAARQQGLTLDGKDLAGSPHQRRGGSYLARAAVIRLALMPSRFHSFHQHQQTLIRIGYRAT
ncbi:hypothetical protein [Serratia fonticola]|uniref:hypothetical protein n=1 Tax=Serratia fonticola TaxID=47917 RepID=UPI0034C6C447